MKTAQKSVCLIAAVVLCLVFAGAVQADSVWLERQKLFASDGATDDRFGRSVSISGDYAIMGTEGDDNGKGSAYIFKWNGTSWVQQQKITASDGAAYDWFGCSVSISGDLAIVGAYGDDSGKGSAYIFKWNGTSWVQQQKITASDGAASDEFGWSVSMSGDLAIVGAIGDDAYKGSAYIFKWNGTSWVPQQKLTASDGAVSDSFGNSVFISGDYAIVGADGGSGNVIYSGTAYIFKWNETSWVQQQKITASDGATDDWFGRSVSISGDLAIVGAIGDDSGEGSAYIFRWNGTSWVQQQKLTTSDGAAGDNFGYSVFISGDYAIVGARGDDDNGSNSGSAYIFKWNGTSWVQQQKVTASDGAAGDWFGYSVSISGNLAIVGAFYDDDSGTDSGSAYIFELANPGTLTLTAPNGGENLIAGASFDINWDTDWTIANVLIEYSANNGGNWTAIDTVANSGSYSWTIADVNSSQCLVRVSDAEYPGANDVSDGVFRIYRCTLNFDSNHDCFVDFRDFAEFASEWLQCGDPANPSCQP